MGQKMGRKTRLIYDRKYYQVEKISHDKHFQGRINDLRGRFASFDCHIPKNGFTSNDEYDDWHNKLIVKRRELRGKKSYINAVKKITGGRATWGQKEQDQLQELEDTKLPPITYLYDLEEILDDFGLNPKDRNDMNWIEGYMFFNRKAYMHPTPIYKLVRDKNNEWELWVRVFGYTRASDIDAAQLADLKRYLPDHKGKNKPQNSAIMIRNKIVKETYLKTRKKLRGKRQRSRVGKSIAVAVAKTLKKKYPALNPNLILKISKKTPEQDES